MGTLDGRVAIITGAAGGLGRAHAELLAAEGARVVVNDVGAAIDGSRRDSLAAERVAAELRAAGHEAVATDHDCADWDGGRAVVDAALAAFGRLDVLVNNAAILRDRTLVNMADDEWDDVLRVNVRGHVAPTRAAAAHWRAEHKAGRPVAASVVHTSSTSGLMGNPGQSNYGASKAAVAAFSAICAQELHRYGIRSNCVVPALARTRLSESEPGLADVVAAPPEGHFDVWDPANVSPLVGYLATASCPFNGATFHVQGGSVRLMEPWRLGSGVDREGRWTVAELADELYGLR